MKAAAAKPLPTQRKPWQLLLIGAIFALPLIASWVFFLNPQWLPGSRSNNGDLVLPPRPVNQIALNTLSGERFDWPSLKGQWVLTTLSQGTCDETCQAQLAHAKRVREAVGPERQRVTRLLIHLPTDAPIQALPEAEDLLQLTPSAIDHKTLSETFMLSEHNPDAMSFLIDPLGFFMMTHQSDQPEKALLRDLEKLLKASQTWEKGGKYGH